MMNSYHAKHGYKTVQREMNSDKAIELKVFISVTSALSRVDTSEIGGHVRLAEALVDNAKLWNLLFVDLVNPDNGLPLDLKINLISLAEFTQSHTLKVLGGEAGHEVLIEINQAVIKGLRQQAELEKAVSLAPPVQNHQMEAV